MRSEQLAEAYPDFEILVADGFDDAIIGFDAASERVVYSITDCIQILKNEGMTEEDAWDHFGFNVQGSYVGKRTPIWCDDTFF